MTQIIKSLLRTSAEPKAKRRYSTIEPHPQTAYTHNYTKRRTIVRVLSRTPNQRVQFLLNCVRRIRSNLQNKAPIAAASTPSQSQFRPDWQFFLYLPRKCHSTCSHHHRREVRCSTNGLLFARYNSLRKGASPRLSLH